VEDLQKEWVLLHTNIEQYERYSLLVKLVAIFASLMMVIYSVNILTASLFLLILWLQDGIWKTFQKRLEKRILFIENKIEKTPNAKSNESSEEVTGAFQYYSQWENDRQGVVGLLKEYLMSSLKPTVAYPYVCLVGLIPIIYYFG
jgi:hypothetical protein